MSSSRLNRWMITSARAALFLQLNYNPHILKIKFRTKRHNSFWSTNLCMLVFSSASNRIQATSWLKVRVTPYFSVRVSKWWSGLDLAASSDNPLVAALRLWMNLGSKRKRRREGLKDRRVKWIESEREREKQESADSWPPWDETIDYSEVITSTFYVCSQTANEASEDQCSLVLSRALAWLSCGCRVAATSSPQSYCLLPTQEFHMFFRLSTVTITFSWLLSAFKNWNRQKKSTLCLTVSQA